MSTGGLIAARKIPLPTPTAVFLEVLVSTGSLRTEYPTVMLSYLGATLVPNPDFLVGVQAYATNFEATDEPKSTVEIVAYHTPKKELMDFADGYFLNVKVDTMKTNDFFVQVEDGGRYALIINTDMYTYRALVDDVTGEILEAMTEYRALH